MDVFIWTQLFSNISKCNFSHLKTIIGHIFGSFNHKLTGCLLLAETVWYVCQTDAVQGLLSFLQTVCYECSEDRGMDLTQPPCIFQQPLSDLYGRFCCTIGLAVAWIASFVHKLPVPCEFSEHSRRILWSIVTNKCVVCRVDWNCSSAFLLMFRKLFLVDSLIRRNRCGNLLLPYSPFQTTRTNPTLLSAMVGPGSQSWLSTLQVACQRRLHTHTTCFYVVTDVCRHLRPVNQVSCSPQRWVYAYTAGTYFSFMLFRSEDGITMRSPRNVTPSWIVSSSR